MINHKDSLIFYFQDIEKFQCQGIDFVIVKFFMYKISIRIINYDVCIHHGVIRYLHSILMCLIAHAANPKVMPFLVNYLTCWQGETRRTKKKKNCNTNFIVKTETRSGGYHDTGEDEIQENREKETFYGYSQEYTTASQKGKHLQEENLSSKENHNEPSMFCDKLYFHFKYKMYSQHTLLYTVVHCYIPLVMQIE